MIKKLFVVTLAAVWLFVFSYNGNGYDDKTTHPALTDEIVDFYNASFSDKLTAEEKELIVQGAIDEDLPPRWINHFYDPISSEGWKSEDLGRVSTITLRFFSRLLFNSNTEVVSSKQWVRDEALQSRYSNYGGNNTWDNALRQYTKGNKKEAYYILGHILHLLEDATVPDHTRNDTHAHEVSSVSQDGGSPYEDYGKNFNRQNLTTAQDLLKAGKGPVLLPSIENYFNELAKYSNGYFFSEDTINKKYSDPKITREDQNYGYGRDKDGKEFMLYRAYEVWSDDRQAYEKIYTLRDKYNKVLPSYFSRLTQEAVANGAGVVKLFHDEAEKIAAGKIQLSAEPQVSWWQAEMRSPLYGVLTAYNDVKYTANQAYTFSKETASAVYDTAVAVKDGAKQAVAATGSFFSKVFSVPLSFLSASVVGVPSAQPATQPIVSQAPTSIASPEDINIVAPQTADIAPPESQIIASVAQPAPSPSPNPNLWIPDVDSPDDTTEPPPTADLRKSDFGNGADQDVAAATVATTTPAVISTPYQGGGWSSGVSQDTAQYTTYDPVYLNTASSTATSTAPIADDSVATSTDDVATSTPDTVTDTATSTDSVATSTESVAVSTTPEIIYDDPVVINEIAWMGTQAQANDEWIEFYNKTNTDIDLAGWTLESRNKSLNIKPTGIIKARSYFLLERTASTTTDQAEDMTFTGAINNSGPEASLYLKNGSTTIDYIDMGYWLAGGSTAANSRRSMERISPYAIGNYSSNWKTYSENLTAPFAKDAKDNNILGTPGAKNSVTGWYVPAAPQITQDTVWRKGHGPYFVSSMMTIVASSTLTIEPGVVIKLAKGAPYGGGINVEGSLKAEGTEAELIIFTSSADDAADGVDTNQDGVSTTPAPGDWMNINFLNSIQPSSLKHIQVKYGGAGTNHNPNGWYPTYTGVVSAKNSSPTIANARIEDNLEVSLYIKGDARPVIKNSVIKNTVTPAYYSGAPNYNYGLYLADASSSAEIIGNRFENNDIAIKSESASASPLVLKDNAFSGNNKNGVFNEYGNFNLENSNNQDADHKGGFNISLYAPNGRTKMLRADAMPYIINYFLVDAGGALTIEPGAILKSANNISYAIRGTLTARGTPENPIIFTALADDSDGYDSNFATTMPQEGVWKNIQFIGASSSDSILENVEVRYGGSGKDACPHAYLGGPCMAYEGAVLIDGSSPIINNSTLDRSLAIALYIKGEASPIISNSTVTNTKEAVATPRTTIGGYGLSIGAESSPALTDNTYGGNAQDVVYR